MPGIKDFVSATFSPRAVIVKAASYTVLAADEWVKINGAYTATLPALNTFQGTTNHEKVYKIENAGTGLVTIQPGTNANTNVADTIGGRAKWYLKPYEFVIIRGSEVATDWTIVDPFPIPALTRVPFAVVVTTSSSSAVNVFDANGAPSNLYIDEILVNALDTIAADITITNGASVMSTIAKGTTLSAIVPATTITYPYVASGATFTVTSAATNGTARVTIFGTMQKYVN